jgi:hypothetical protein
VRAAHLNHHSHCIFKAVCNIELVEARLHSQVQPPFPSLLVFPQSAFLGMQLKAASINLIGINVTVESKCLLRQHRVALLALFLL